VPTPSDAYPRELSVGVTSSRVAMVSTSARVVHKVILRAFATTGHAPDLSTLTTAVPDGRELAGVLVELHDHDVVRLDAHGGIRGAYPFSGVPTAHVVAIDGGPVVYAMCAIDALGIAAMLGRNVTIASADPVSGAEIRVSIHNGRARWLPASAVVFVGSDTSPASTGGQLCPPEATEQAGTVVAADRCCGVMNFFTTRRTARAWIAAHPTVSGMVLAKERALRLGIDIFGALLDDGPDSPITGDPP
jgi:hypothetical protein